MFKILALTFCLLSFASAGLVTTNHVIHESALAKVGHVVHSAPSAVSHQSITQVHGESHVVHPILAPAIKTSIHAAPVLVKTVEPVIPFVKTVLSPTVHTYYAAPVVHSIPLEHDTASVVSVHHHHHHQ